MVAPSEKNESKITTRSFARENVTMTPAKSSRIMTDRKAAEVWSLASEAVAERFDILARLAMAATWYQALSADEELHWLSYFCDDVTAEGIAVRRIPRSVTEALGVAGKRGCFDGYMIKANLERRQQVLIGLLDDGEAVRHYPIIAWYPSKSPIPARKELKELYESKVAALERKRAETEAWQAEEVEARHEEWRQAKRLSRMYWGIASAPLVAINLVLLVVFSPRWAFCSLIATLVGAWLVLEVNDGYTRTVAAVRGRLPVSLAVLIGIVGSLIGLAMLV